MRYLRISVTLSSESGGETGEVVYKVSGPATERMLDALCQGRPGHELAEGTEEEQLLFKAFGFANPGWYDRNYGYLVKRETYDPNKLD